MAKYAGPEHRCIISGELGADLHHVITRGAGGSDDPKNLMPLSHKHHVAVHQLGLRQFAELYLCVHEWLLENGWELVNGKWFNPAARRHLKPNL